MAVDLLCNSVSFSSIARTEMNPNYALRSDHKINW